jgi:hypothetical protein
MEQLAEEASTLPPDWTWNGYTQDQLETAFNAVKNKDQWKGPIEAKVTANELALAYWSIVFYTATNPEVSYDEDTGEFHITSEGYWLGPAGP